MDRPLPLASGPLQASPQPGEVSSHVASPHWSHAAAQPGFEPLKEVQPGTLHDEPDGNPAHPLNIAHAIIRPAVA